MKKILFTVITGILFTFNALAQGPPDFGFELPWTSSGGNAQGWASAKFLVPNVVQRDSIIYHFGGRSAKITTSDVSFVSGQTNGLLPPTSGIMLTGTIGLTTPPVTLGYSFSQRKDTLAFFARYQPVGVDTAFAQVIFYKRNAQRDTIATGYTKISATSGNFNLHYVEMVYNPDFPSTTLPDSALIIFSSSMPVGAQLGSTLWVDDLQWGTVNTGLGESLSTDAVKLTPNPANEFITLELGNNTSAKIIEILDVNGKLIESFLINSKTENFGISHLSNGMYFYTVKDNKSMVLNTGKFTIKH